MTYPAGGQPQEQPQHYPQPPGYPPQQPPGGYGYPPPPQGGDGPPGGYPQEPHGQPPKKSRLGLIIGLAVLALLVVGGSMIGGAVLLTEQGKGPFVSEEKRVEIAVRDFYETLDSKGARAAIAKSCSKDRAEFDAMSAAGKASFDETRFEATIDKIDNIVIMGDKASAQITGKLTVTAPGVRPDTDTSTTEHLRREDGTWKVCSQGGA